MANQKRKQGEGTVRLRTDGRWEGRVVIGYDEKGLPKTKNIIAKTKFECEEKLRILKETLGKAIARLKPEMPFGEWMDFWYQNFLPYGKPHERVTKIVFIGISYPALVKYRSTSSRRTTCSSFTQD